MRIDIVARMPAASTKIVAVPVPTAVTRPLYASTVATVDASVPHMPPSAAPVSLRAVNISLLPTRIRSVPVMEILARLGRVGAGGGLPPLHDAIDGRTRRVSFLECKRRPAPPIEPMDFHGDAFNVRIRAGGRLQDRGKCTMKGDRTAVLRSIRRREVEHTISMMYGKRPPMQQRSTD